MATDSENPDPTQGNHALHNWAMRQALIVLFLLHAREVTGQPSIRATKLFLAYEAQSEPADSFKTVEAFDRMIASMVQLKILRQESAEVGVASPETRQYSLGMPLKQVLTLIHEMLQLLLGQLQGRQS